MLKSMIATGLLGLAIVGSTLNQAEALTQMSRPAPLTTEEAIVATGIDGLKVQPGTSAVNARGWSAPGWDLVRVNFVPGRMAILWPTRARLMSQYSETPCTMVAYSQSRAELSCSGVVVEQASKGNKVHSIVFLRPGGKAASWIVNADCVQFDVLDTAASLQCARDLANAQYKKLRH